MHPVMKVFNQCDTPHHPRSQVIEPLWVQTIQTVSSSTRRHITIWDSGPSYVHVRALFLGMKFISMAHFPL